MLASGCPPTRLSPTAVSTVITVVYELAITAAMPGRPTTVS